MAKNRSKDGQKLEQILRSAGFTPEEPEWNGLIITFGGDAPQPKSPNDLGDIDNDYSELRPVNFDPETGERLVQGSPAAATAMERIDIQLDEHYCIWCGTRISNHYSPMSQWIPCLEVLRLNAVALRYAQEQTNRGGRDERK